MAQIVHQFQDLRHVFTLPEIEGRFFGRRTSSKILFGEVQLLDDPLRRMAALTGPIELDMRYVSQRGSRLAVGPRRSAALRRMKGEIVLKLEEAGYREARGPVPREGEFLAPKGSATVFYIFLKPNYYPLTMVGLDRDRTTLFLSAISGLSGRFSLTVPDAARLFRDRLFQSPGEPPKRVHDALVLDEGLDVFQQVGGQQPIQLKRRQVRAVIAVGRRP